MHGTPPATLLDVIPAMGSRTTTGITGYDRRGRAEPICSWSELGHRAAAIGWELQRLIGADGLTPEAAGDAPRRVVMLQLPNGVALVEHFFGAIAAGLLPMCLAPMRALGGVEAFRERLQTLHGAFPGAVFIADKEHGEAAGVPYVEPLDGAALRTTRGGEPALEPLPGKAPDPEAIAFLQLTSGSTHAPKAVRISHRAAWAQVRGLRDAVAMPAGSATVSWLPLYHDMGLVGCTLYPALLGIDLHLFRPETFLARPMAWLEAISSTSQPVLNSLPDFALRHCVERIPQDKVASLDLSNWYWLGCGAERVRPETLQTFSAHFVKAGLPAHCFGPCYGLAEASLGVTLHRSGKPIRVVQGQVGCGMPLPDTEVEIRAPDDRVLAEGESGEVAVRCPSLFSGYTGPGLDHATVVGLDAKGWLHTGDRGFLHEGELFLTGRIKDLIIVDGENFAPEDVEWIADHVVAETGARHAAFAVATEDREAVILVAELTPERTAELAVLRDAIGEQVAKQMGLTLREILFVRRGSLPKTSSGKIRRGAVRDLWRAQELAVLTPDHP